MGFGIGGTPLCRSARGGIIDVMTSTGEVRGRTRVRSGQGAQRAITVQLARPRR